MVSSIKDTHRCAFELVKAAREMSVYKAEELEHIKELRFRHQVKALKKESIKSFARAKQQLLLGVSFH